MGQGGYITLVNGTRYDWTRTHEHSYQMNSWSFPQTIRAGQSATVYVEWGQSIFGNSNDDAGEAIYTLKDVGQEFQVQARVSDRNFRLEVAFQRLATPGNPAGSILNLGWQHDGYVSFVLAGEVGRLVSSNPPTSWMHDNLTWLGHLNLRRLCMPGSHDAGMSVRNGGTAFAPDCAVLTQTQQIRGQLIQGARYFDVRPVISAGQYFAGHYSHIDAIKSWQGANGQRMESIIDDINQYTRDHAELIIVNLSHDLNTDLGNDSYAPFTQGEWNGLLTMLEKLDFRYVDDPKVDLSQQTLEHYIGQNKASVVLIVDPGASGISIKNLGQGFFTNGNLPIYDSYADSNRLDSMASDQLKKMAEQRTRPDCPCFLLSWTLTQDTTQATTCHLPGGGSSILDLAKIANPALPGKLWPAITKLCYPNILYTDNVSTSVSTALALAVNWMAAT